MTDQSAGDAVRDATPAPSGLRELPPQPARPAMPSFPSAPVAATTEAPSDEAGPGPDDSVIATDDHLEGTFTSRGTIRVEGSIDGRIEAVRVRIEEGAKVTADVVVDEAIIAGEFDGNLTCRRRLEARPTGRIKGRVETHKLMLHEGASVEGEMHMLTEASTTPDETIRGTAPVRGEDRDATSAANAQVAPPAPRSTTRSTPSATAARPDATAAAEPIPTQRASGPTPATSSTEMPEFRLTPRTTTAASGTANGQARNGSSERGSTSRL